MVFTVIPGHGVTLRWPAQEMARHAQLARSSPHSSQICVVSLRLTRCVDGDGGFSS